MKLLHTGDWHLGRVTGGVDRTGDLFARLEELGQVLDAEQVDVLLVAGDVFDEARGDRLPPLLRRLGAFLAPRVADGLQAVFVAGNHDREHMFPLLRAASGLFGPAAAERVTFAERPTLLRVPSRAGDEQLQVLCLPYPTGFRYDLAARSWPSPEARRRELADAVRTRIAELTATADRTAPGVPAVLVGHFLVRGVTVGPYGYCLSEADDVPVERGDLPSYAYVALGHIHQPQTVGAAHIRYAGSIERMDQGEAADDKSAVLVTLDPSGTAAYQTVPLDATPFRRVEAADEADLEAARAALVDPDRTMVSLRLRVAPTTSIGVLLARARALFPRLYGAPTILTPPPRAGAGAPAGFDRADVAGTVRGWLTDALDGDRDRDELLALADELLADDAGPPPATAEGSRS